MTHFKIGLIAPALFIAFTTSAQADLKRIKDEATFVSTVAGKTLKAVEGGGTVKVRKNGKISGKFDGKKLVGAWQWRKNLFCRTVKLGKSDLGTACQKIEASDSQVRFTTTKTGRVTLYNF